MGELPLERRSPGTGSPTPLSRTSTETGSTYQRSTSRTLSPSLASWESTLPCTHGKSPPRIATSSLTGRLATSTPNSGRKNGTLKMRSKSLKQSRPQQKGVGLVNPGLARGLILSVIPLSDGNCFFDSLPAPHKKNNG